MEQEEHEQEIALLLLTVMVVEAEAVGAAVEGAVGRIDLIDLASMISITTPINTKVRALI